MSGEKIGKETLDLEKYDEKKNKKQKKKLKRMIITEYVLSLK